MVRTTFGRDVGDCSQHVARGGRRPFRDRASQAEVVAACGAIGGTRMSPGLMSRYDTHAVGGAQSTVSAVPAES